jgi:hypothetical protein
MPQFVQALRTSGSSCSSPSMPSVCEINRPRIVSQPGGSQTETIRWVSLPLLSFPVSKATRYCHVTESGYFQSNPRAAAGIRASAAVAAANRRIDRSIRFLLSSRCDQTGERSGERQDIPPPPLGSWSLQRSVNPASKFDSLEKN